VSNEFARRLRDIVDGVRSEAEARHRLRAPEVGAAKARRRHLEKAAVVEAGLLVTQAGPVFASLGMRSTATATEIRVEPIPGARLTEEFPPWLRISCRTAAFEAVRVAVLEMTWRVDDPRTPLPESPNTVRLVVDDDSAAGMAEVREFVSVAMEDFAANVTKYDVLPKA